MIRDLFFALLVFITAHFLWIGEKIKKNLNKFKQ
jgi:hypothetical protein